MTVKLVAIDLDGTTFDNKTQISKENINAIKKAISMGVQIVPCTGRALYEMPNDIMKIDGINYGVLSNGASVMNMKTAEKIYSNELDFETASQILDLTNEYDCLVEIYHNGQPYSQKNKMTDFSHYLIEEKYFDVLTNSRKAVEDIPKFFKNNCKSAEKLNLFFASLNQRKEFWSKMDLFKNNIEVTSSMTSNMEINKLGANKGDGLAKLCSHLNIDLSEVIAIGDSDNDISMLKVAGISVAVENAMPSVKKFADYITVKNTENAVEKVLKNHLQF